MRSRPVLLALLALMVSAVPAFANPFQWPQPQGFGTPVTVTYSLANLFDGNFHTVLGDDELRAETALAFDVWARHIPVTFIEIPDRGPAISEAEYFASDYANIRIGYEADPGPNAAHAHLPVAGNPSSGLAGDIHLNNSYRPNGTEMPFGNADQGFYMDYFSVMLHEIGHSLGLEHNFTNLPSVMSGFAAQIFLDHDRADLFASDINNIQAIYGAGHGRVYPLAGSDPAHAPEPASVLLLASGAAWLVRGRVTRRAGRRSR